MNLHIQEAERNTNSINPKKFTSFKLKIVQKTQEKNIPKAMREGEKKHLNRRGKVIKMTVGFSSEIMEAERSGTIVSKAKKINK